MSYIGTSINTSATITANAAGEMQKCAGKAVKFDTSGRIKLCDTEGEAMVGIPILQTADTVKEGESLTIQVDCMGKAVAGGVISAGDLLTVDSAGAMKKAASGNVIAAQALSACTAGGMVNIQILKGGKA